MHWTRKFAITTAAAVMLGTAALPAAAQDSAKEKN